MDALIKDIRYGVRSLLKHRGLTALAIVTLALGIGANTAMFSVINAVLLRPLPYHEPERLVWMNESGPEVASRWLSYPNFVDWRERNKSFESMSTFRGWSVTLTGMDQPLNLNARMVAADYFQVMRVAPWLGREFTTDDDQPGASPVTILSHGFWQTQFASDPNIVGKTITLDDRAYTVIGVMPRGFAHQGPPPLWLPIGPQDWKQRDVRIAGNVIARLKPGVTIEQARAEINGIAQQLAHEHPVANAGADRVNVVSLQDSVTGNVAPALLILFGAVGLVLLIACANVANLLLARAATRRKEFAVRAALGATRARIIRQLLIESLLLSLAGGVFGLLLASWSTALLSQVAHETIPRLEGLQLSDRVLGFNLLVSLLSGLVFGLAPAWRFSRAELQETLKDSAATTSEREGKKLRGALVIAEVALSVALLAGAGLLIKSMLRLSNSNAGFDPHNVLTMELKVSGNRYRGKGELARLLQQVLDRVQAQPGVETATLSITLPGFESWTNDIFPEGHAEQQPGELINVDWVIVSADYFKTMRIPILKGRTFTRDEDTEGRPVVLVDENLARRFWPHEDAVGKHIKYDSPNWHEIVGVVKEVNAYGSEAKPLIKIYTPLGRGGPKNATLSVRTTNSEPQNLVAAITREIHVLDKDLPVTEVATLEDILAREVSPKRFNTALLSIFAPLFSGVDPLTQRISVEELISGGTLGQPVEWQIVGVFHNVRGGGFREDYPEIDVPFWQSPWPQTSMVVRTDGDPKRVIKSIAAAVGSVDQDLPLAGVKTIDEIVNESLVIDRFGVVLFGSFGILGLLLAAVGIYGVMAFGVAQRTQEFGVRIALGAQRSRVLSLVLKEGTILAAIGATIGLGGAYLVGRAMQSTLYGVGAMDARAFGALALVLLVAALLACFFPAWRASRIEPMVALRYE